MGFWDKLGDALADPFEYDWKRVGEDFKSAGKSAWNGLLSARAGAFNLAMSVWDDDLSARAAMQEYVKGQNELLNAVGSTGSALSGVPVLRQLFGFFDWAQTELVKRPSATAALVGGDVMAGTMSPSELFDGDRWKQAYNTTTYVTPGQAFTYASLAQYGIYRDLGDLERRDILRRNPTLGIIAQKPADLDPRNRELREQYKTNDILKYASGTLDAGITIFGDPTIVLGKLGVAGKARFWSQEMNAAAIAKGRHVEFMDSKAYAKGKAFTQEAASPDIVVRTMYNNKYNGDFIGNLLWEVAQDQAKYELRGGTHDLYDLTWLALYGDQASWELLAKDAPRIADVVGRKFANYTMGNLGKQYGLGDAEIDKQWDALRETEAEAFIDAMVSDRGAFGQFGKAAMLGGQAVPRLRASSKWRAGFHSWIRPDPGQKFGWWARRGRHILPTARTGRMLDLNDINSARVFRANLEHSRLSEGEIAMWVSAYARATSPASRFAIYNSAENAALRKHAARYGIDNKKIETLLPMVNKWRTGNRQIFASNRRFMSADVRKLAQKRIAENKKAEADELNALADQIDQAVARGDMPGATIDLPDEDTGGVVKYAVDTDISTTGPVMVSQQADVVPMVDWNVLENALWWGTKGGFGKRAYQTIDWGRSALDSLMSVWKVSAILRPGYLWRTLSDEIGRSWAVMGSGRVFASTVPAATNTQHNMWSRGLLLGEIARRRVARRKATGNTDIVIEGEVVDEVPTAVKGSLATDARFDPIGAVRGGQVYTSFERAFADGLIGVDDLIERFEAMGKAGTLPRYLATIYHGKFTADSYKGADRMYRRHVVDAVMSSLDHRDAYNNPGWQEQIINELVDQAPKPTRKGAKAQPARKKPKVAGQVGRGVIVDPFSGLSPKLKWDKVPDNFSMSKTRVLLPDQDGRFEPDHVYAFVADNVDELLKPGAMLSAHFRPDGKISLSVAKVNKEVAAKLNIKPSAGRRIKWPFSKAEGRLYRDSGMADFVVPLGNGQQVTVRGAFAGPEGERTRAQVSSRGPDDAWTDYITNTEFARLMAKAGRWADINATNIDEYRVAWERAVNLQLANDAVGRQFLAGKTVDDVVAWMHNTTEGRAYNAKMGPWRARYADQVEGVRAMVDLYAPIVEGREAASWALREKVLAREAKFDDFETLVPREDMPRVHGASLELATGSGRWVDWMRKRVDSTFKWLSDIPADKFVRYPLANERYRLHVQDQLRIRGAQLGGKTISEPDVRFIEAEARSRALMDVKKYLYESASALDLAKAFRLLVPFGSAIGDSTIKWGVVLREKPWVANQVWKLWTAPERAGLIQDEDGNHLRMENGREVWYQIDPKTGEEARLDDHAPKSKRIVFRLPAWMGPEYVKGMQPAVRLDKNVFHTFLDMPTFGPLVTVPANEFALSHPEFDENKFIRTFMLPYGPSADIKRSAMPGNVRTFWDRFKGEDAPEAQGQAQSIFVTEMVSYAQGKRDTPPSYEEARAKAADLRGLRFWWRLSGVSAQFISPYQPYIDYYHMLQQKSSIEAAKAERGERAEPFDPDARFYEEMGPEFFALTARMTSNVMGLQATVGAFKQHRRFRELMESFPELAPLISGAEGAGEFSRAVYEAQKQTEVRFGGGRFMREPLSPVDSWADLQRRQGWIEYSRYMDSVHADMKRLGVTSLEQKPAQRLRQARERWLQSRQFVDSPYGGTVINPWFQEFASFDKSAMTGRLHAMRQIVRDKDLQGRDDIEGLIDYLHMRGQFKQAMQFYKFSTLDSQKATRLRRQWQASVFNLKNNNLSFAQLYDRWLSSDETLEAD